MTDKAALISLSVFAPNDTRVVLYKDMDSNGFCEIIDIEYLESPSDLEWIFPKFEQSAKRFYDTKEIILVKFTGSKEYEVLATKNVFANLMVEAINAMDIPF